MQLLRADDDLVVHADSPQRIRSLFRVTNLGAVLGDDRGAGIRERLAAALLPDEEHGSGMRALLLRMLDTDASLDFAAHFEAAEGGTGDADGVAVLTPAKGLDANQLAHDIETALRASGLAIGSVEVDGVSYSTVRVGDGAPLLTLPVLHEGKLVFVLGDHLDKAIARRMAKTTIGPWPHADAEWKGASLGLHLDLARMTPTWIAYGRPKQEKALAEAFGLDSLRHFRLLVRAAGPNIEIDGKLAFDERGPRGIFAGVFTDHPTPPTLAGLATADAVDWFAGKFDLQAFAGALMHIAAIYSLPIDGEGDLQKQIAEMRRQSRDLFGVDIESELGAAFSHEFFVGDAHAFVPDVPAPGTVVDGEAVETGFVFAATASDAESLAKSTRALCGSSVANWLDLDGEAAMREGVEIHGTKDPRIAWLSPTFVFAFGPRVDDVVTRAALRAKAIRETKEVPLPRILERVRRRFPAGFQGCGVIDLGSVASVVLFQLGGFGMLDVSLPEPDQWKAFVEELRTPLHALELDKVAITTGYSEHAFTLRVHW